MQGYLSLLLHGEVLEGVSNCEANGELGVMRVEVCEEVMKRNEEENDSNTTNDMQTTQRQQQKDNE